MPATRVINKVTDLDDVDGSGQANGDVLTWNSSTGKYENTAPSGGGTPGGSTTQVQYNNAGAFAGASGITVDGSGHLNLGSGKKLYLNGTQCHVSEVGGTDLYLTGQYRSSLTCGSTHLYNGAGGTFYFVSGAGSGNTGLVYGSFNSRNAWVIGINALDATYASFKGRMTLSAVDYNGPREIIRLDADGSAGCLSFFGATAVVKQTSGANLTNNVTSGGTDDTIANFTDLTTYATDAAAIRNNIYQLARKLKQVNDALRAYGLLT